MPSLNAYPPTTGVKYRQRGYCPAETGELVSKELGTAQVETIHNIAASFMETAALLPRATLLATKRFVQRERTIFAAALAYYGLFSLFPLALLILAAVAHIWPNLADQAPILELAGTYFPGIEPLLQANLQRLVHARTTIGFFSLLSLLWSASSVFTGIGRALEKMLGHPESRPSLRYRLLGIVMVFVTAIAGIVLFGATVLFQVLAREGAGGSWLPEVISILPRTHVDVVHVISASTGVVIIFLTTLLVYRFFPSVSLPWRDLWPGALLSTAGLTITRNGFAAYVTSIQQYELIYGTLAAAIVILLWFFVSTVVFLWGAEVSSVLHGMRSNWQDWP